MADLEKIYCCDRSDDNALAAAILAGRDHKGMDPALTAMMANGGMNGMWNNPFVYLVWMMFAGRFFNNGGWDGNCNGQGAQNIEMQNRLQAIRSQRSDNQNSNLLMDAIKGNACAIGQLASNLNCDFNTLNQAICCVQSAIQQVGCQVGYSAERVINAVNMGDCNVIQAIKDCCCTTQKSILEMGYQSQLQSCQQTNTIMTGIAGVNTGVERGFANLGNIINQGFTQVGFRAQQDKCDLINAGNANTQRIIDTLNSHWNDELSQKNQDLKFELSQLRQNQYLAGIINGNNGCGCGCNNGCGC